MAKIYVKYTSIVVETFDWPDDEMDDFNEDNLLENIGTDLGDTEIIEKEIVKTLVNGEKWEF